MKKLKLNTAKLQIKKGTIVSLTTQQMRQVYGGETGPCTTYPCETGATYGCPLTASTTPDCCGGHPTSDNCTGAVCTWSCGCESETGPGTIC